MARQVRRRFGGSCFGDSVEDVIQDCYKKQLSRPGVLESFRPPLQRAADESSDEEARRGAFHRWLWGVVNHACINARKDLRRRALRFEPSKPPDPTDTDPSVIPYEPPEASDLDPEAEYFRRCDVRTHDKAIEKVRRLWKAKGWGLRFEVLLPHLADDRDRREVAALLGVSTMQVGSWAFQLRRELRAARDPE